MDANRRPTFHAKSRIDDLLKPETRASFKARLDGRPLDDRHHWSVVCCEDEEERASTVASEGRGMPPICRTLRSHVEVDEKIARFAKGIEGSAVHKAVSASSVVVSNHPNYEILGEIGRSESAVVYEAYEPALRRYVAIKQLSERFQGDLDQSELFWKEARFLAGLSHENIVRVYAVDEQRRWIIMELMSGSLNTNLSEGALSADLVRSVLVQALKGLTFLHRQDKLHGEIKPSKLLIDDVGRIKLSASPGFSVNGEFRRPTGSQKQVAPELLIPAAFGDVGPAVDLYCLGFTVLELLTGRNFNRLFKGISEDSGDTDIAWMRWHSSPTEQLPPVEEIAPAVPADMARVVDRLLKKQVAQRYASAEEALKDLEEKPIVLVNVAEKPRATPVAEPSSGGAVMIGVPPVFHKRQASSDPKPKQEPAGMRAAFLRCLDSGFWQAQFRNPKFLYSVLGVVAVAMLVTLIPAPTPPVVADARGEAVDVPAQPKVKHARPSPKKSAVATAKSPVVKPVVPEPVVTFVPVAQASRPPVGSQPEVDTPKPSKPPVEKPVIRVVGDRPFDLPNNLTAEQRAQYFRCLQQLVELPRDATAKARATYLEATRACDDDSRIRVAYALFLCATNDRAAVSRLLDEAIEIESARMKAGRDRHEPCTVYLGPWKYKIWSRFLVSKVDYSAAASDCHKLLKVISGLHKVDSSLQSRNNPDDPTTGYVVFAGKLMGFLEGPARRECKTAVDFEGYDSDIRTLLSEELLTIYAQAKEGVQHSFADELKKADQQHAQYDALKQQLRASGETAKTTIDSTRTIRDKSKTSHDTDTPIARKSDGASTGGNLSTVSMEQPMVLLNDRDQNSLELDSDTKYQRKRTRFSDPHKPWIREPYDLFSYVKVDMRREGLKLLETAPEQRGTEQSPLRTISPALQTAQAAR